MPDWKKYYEKTGGAVPSPFAELALTFVNNKSLAIDLGAGSLKDTKFFADAGFEKVIAYDASPAILERLTSEYADKIECVVSKFEEFNYPTSSFDLVYSKVSFQFIQPEKFEATFKNIAASVNSGGIFALTTLGPKDAWNSNKNMTFVTTEQLIGLLSDFEILRSNEEEYDRSPALGGPEKHWHVVTIIARKK